LDTSVLMNRKSRLKRLACMAFSVLATFLVSSCTSDEFFGIKEDYDGVDYSTMEKIAKSKEYIEFKKQEFICMKELFLVDSAQTEIIDTIRDKCKYVLKGTYSIQPPLEARKKMVASYPEYDNSTSEERNLILNIALNSDRSLRKLAVKCIPNIIHRTKSANYESDAVRWVRSAHQYELISDTNGCTDLVSGANSMWCVNGLTVYAYSEWLNALYNAISLSILHHTEYGGFSWADSDCSGILIEDPYATIRSMHYTNIEGEPNPSFDFHVHPSGTLTPSETDIRTWDRLPWTEHHIIDSEGRGKMYMGTDMTNGTLILYI